MQARMDTFDDLRNQVISLKAAASQKNGQGGVDSRL
jgi:hypothetical protein